MADFLIDDIDDDMMSRIEMNAQMHGLTAECWVREVIVALAEKREPNFAQARVDMHSNGSSDL